MANTTRRDVELRINANDLSEKTLQQLLDTFEKLRKSQEALAKSGDGTQRSVRELRQDLADLQAVAVELKSRAALVDQFLAIEKRASDAAVRVEAAKAALQKFNAAQAAGTELTKKEQAEFTRLTREVQRAEKSLDTNTAKLKEFNATLEQMGAGGADQTRAALLRFSGDLGASLAAAEQSIRNYDAALRASEQKEKDATEAKVKATKAAQQLKAAQDALTSSVAFNQQGREALKAASNVEALTRDYDKLAQSSRKAGDGIREILDPSRQALASLDGLEGEIKRLNTQLNTLQGSPRLAEELKQIRGDYTALAADAGKAAASLVDDIGSYRKVEQAVAALRARLEGAQQSVREFASQMAVTTEPSEKLAKDLAGAQAKLKGLVGEFERESTALAGLRLRLREAGVDVDRLAEAEQRLAQVAVGVVESQRKIGAVAGRVDALTKATAGLKAAQDELEGGVAFNQLGRDALRAAANVEALSKDYDALAATSRKAGDSIRGIIDPSRQAMASIDGLEEQTRQLNEQLTQAASSVKLREEVRRLRSEYGSLAADSGKAAAALADQIGTYRQNEQAVGTLRARVEAAQQTVQKFAGQMAVAAKPSDELAKGLAQAKAQLASVVAEFERQSTSLANLRAALREAGVDVGNLAAAEQRLEAVARGVVTAQRALGTATVRVGNDAAKGAKGLHLFEDSGRKALSTAQRLRGEVLSLASSYLGLFAAVNVAKESVDAAVTREGILRRLELVEGSADKAAAKFKYLREQADKLGLNFEITAKGFSDIAISAREAGLSSEELDRFFENLATTTRGLSLDAEKTNRVFTAVAQVLSKNKLQSEELVQQLGEHLPAVVVKAAKALNMNADELRKNLEEGNLSARAMVVIVEEYANHVRQLSKQQKSATEAITRFGNAIFDLKLAIADAGFLETFIDLLTDAKSAIASGELNGAIQGLASLLRLAGEAARFLLEHITATEVALVAFIALNVGKVLLGIAANMKTLGLSAWIAKSGVTALGAAMAFVAANPIVALIAGLGLLVVGTETGRGALRAFHQVIKEVGGAIADLLRWDTDAFFKRIEGSARRVGLAFRFTRGELEQMEDAIAQAEDKQLALAKQIQETLKKRGIKADIVDKRKVATSAADAAKAEEQKEKERAERTARTVEGIDKRMNDLRKAAAKETAKALHNIEDEVRAEYRDTQDEIDKLTDRGIADNDQAVLAAARAQQAKFDDFIATVVKARKKLAAEQAATKFAKGDINERLEEARQEAETIKDGLRIKQSILEQDYKEGLVSLRDYYEKRLKLTNEGLDAEITAAGKQIEILETQRGKDPNAGKKIAKLEGDIKRKDTEKKINERDFAVQAELGEKALRGQVSALQQELEELTGEDRQAGLRAIQAWYLEQEEKIKNLSDAEKVRAQTILQQVVGLKIQHNELKAMAEQADHLAAMREVAISSAVATGDLSPMQELAARSEANKAYLADLEAQAAMFTTVEEQGSKAYKAIQRDIVRLRGETDLLANEVTKVFKDAATSLVQTLIETKSPQQALKAFGKSLGSAVSKAFVDEAASAIVKFFKQSGAFDFVKSLFSGIGSLFGGGKTAHTGAVIGYSGAVDKRVSPFAFIGAERYHGGGLPGLRHDEVATILKRREEVLAVDDPRNVLNGGKSNSVPAPAGPVLVQLHPDAMHMSLRDWLERELARAGASQ